ncbi:MAG: hypothetical protein NWF06_01080 [Candidatus Bathyarchaeota archaeon]|nr:hypothetical protein [Candidatus Bathyarchaeum sp.]
MNRKIILPLVFVLVVMLFSGIESSLAEGTVGVFVGQSSDYTYALSGTQRYSDGTLNMSVPFTVSYLETITIQQVIGTNVTFSFVRDFFNGTEESGLSWIDVSDGDGSGFFVIISANLNEGDIVYPDLTDENGTTENVPRVTETLFLNYGSAHMEVNRLTVSYTSDDGQQYDEEYYWEKATGILVKYRITGSGVADDITQTLNIHFQDVGLEQVFYPLIDSKQYPVAVSSDSDILRFSYNETEQSLFLNVTGKTGTSGSCYVAVPDDLLWGTFSLNMDGYELVRGDDYTQKYNGTHYIFHVNYIHSSHVIEFTGANDISLDEETIDPDAAMPADSPETDTPVEGSTEEALLSMDWAIIVAVAVACIIGVVAFWALKKRK